MSLRLPCKEFKCNLLKAIIVSPRKQFVSHTSDPIETFKRCLKFITHRANILNQNCVELYEGHFKLDSNRYSLNMLKNCK